MGSLDAPKELFKDVVGALGLDQHGTGGSLDKNRIGKELLPVLINLLDHFLSSGILAIVLAAGQPGPELRYTFLDGADMALLSLVIEPGTA